MKICRCGHAVDGEKEGSGLCPTQQLLWPQESLQQRQPLGICQLCLPSQRNAHTMGEAIPGLPKSSLSLLGYIQKSQVNITRMGKTLFQMSTICPDLPQTDVPQASSISLSFQKSPSHATSNPCSPTPFFSSWSALLIVRRSLQFHKLFLVAAPPPWPCTAALM